MPTRSKKKPKASKKAKAKKKAAKRSARRPKPKRKARATTRKAKVRTAARATKRKVVKATKRKPAAGKRKARKGGGRKAAVRKPKPKKAIAPPRPRAIAAAAPMAAPSAPAPAPLDDLRARVEAALRIRGYTPPDPVVVDVLTAIGRGYRMGPANPPPWLNVNGPIADGVAERFALGDRAHDIDRSTHRGTTRATVDFVCDQMAPDVEDAERAAIASFSLGSWNPQVDTNAERNAIGGFVIAWYLAGR